MKILRPLDFLEKIYLKLQLSNIYGCNVHFIILFPALEKIISKTPHLCISIKDAKTSNPQFV
ncbi:4903_t:CDS:2, partial [Scutellospora calospora]